MKNLVAFVCMIFALVSSVLSYQCYSAFCPNSTTCKENVTECLGDRCMTACQYDGLSGTYAKSMMKGCAIDTMCGDNGLAAAAEGDVYQFRVNCCSGDLCNTDGCYLPKEDPTPNGVTCPSAYCNGTMDECEPNKEMECTGSMDRCFVLSQRVINEAGEESESFIKGCANPDACKYNFTEIAVDNEEKKYAKCYDPSKSNYE
ncbi:uncharacterized protein ACNLHF_002666 [Anomaloglossus baeobatrachus]|uniref:uncharacterized protein LOC142256407 n=1 Tax=Anomaloglossus baeobatrachus TaxID=238106 RepID=UPI003F505827